jgi:hypothetical protein
MPYVPGKKGVRDPKEIRKYGNFSVKYHRERVKVKVTGKGVQIFTSFPEIRVVISNWGTKF